MEGAIAGDDGVDVLYVGESLAVADESTFDAPPVPDDAQDAFAARLPFAWYAERVDAETASVASPEALSGPAPPVVVTTPTHRAALSRALPGYERYEVNTGLTDRTLVVFVDG